MSSHLVESSYGKSRVRLTKVTRRPERQDIKEITVNIQLQGQFDRSYTDGDNSQVIATDTMKNTVYALAARHPIDTIEEFAKHLCDHFLSRNQHVHAVSVEIAQERWERISVDGKPHAHSFTGGSKEKRVTHVDCVRGCTSVESGIEELVVLKTSGSEFWGFLRDEFTTLPELRDRIFATSVMAHWLYKSADAEFDKTYETVRALILKIFAEHQSLAVQQTIFEIGKQVLAACPQIEEIRISMPNQHRLPMDTAVFGVASNNEIFVPTDEPFGLISATIGREPAGKAAATAELQAQV